MFEILQAESLLQGLHWRGRSSLTIVGWWRIEWQLCQRVIAREHESSYVAVYRNF